MACNNTLSLSEANWLIASAKALGHPAMRVGGTVHVLYRGSFGEGRSADITAEAREWNDAAEQLEREAADEEEGSSDED